MATTNGTDTVRVESAPVQGKPLTKEERALKYANIRKLLATSRISVTPPPGRACRWVRRDDQSDISLHEFFGFQISREPDIKVPSEQRRFKTSANPQADGSYIIGDVILMDIDEETYEMLKEESLDRAKAQAGMAKEAFKKDAEQSGVPVFERDR